MFINYHNPSIKISHFKIEENNKFKPKNIHIFGKRQRNQEHETTRKQDETRQLIKHLLRPLKFLNKKHTRMHTLDVKKNTHAMR